MGYRLTPSISPRLMILNFGSINVDHVYRVDHLPTAGETLPSRDYQTYLGGKGLNQSVAIHRAGGMVRHIGATGADGSWAREQMREAGVSTKWVESVAEPTGHAVITVDNAGENQILIYPGANHSLTADQINLRLDDAMAETSWVLVQNETNLVSRIVDEAKHRNLRVAYSAAPFVPSDALSVLDRIDLLAVNAVEHAALVEQCPDPLDTLGCSVLITRGSEGAQYISDDVEHRQDAIPVEPVDTTGAGDTFLGSFLGRLDVGDDERAALRYAATASAIQVTRAGAAAAIPSHEDVSLTLRQQDGDH